MKYRFISDSHTHSECSFDGTDSVIMLCEQASALEMYSITITDHCECNEYFENNVIPEKEKHDRFPELKELITVFGDDIRVQIFNQKASLVGTAKDI